MKIRVIDQQDNKRTHTNGIYKFILQVQVADHEVGEMRMKDPNYMAFIYFPKNYTQDLIKYIDRRNFDAESRTYIHLTKESK